MTTLNFDPSTVEPQAPMSSEPLPAGIYTAEITSADVKELKSGNGTGLALEFTILEPEAHARRKVWANLNIVHTNEQAQQIAQSQLAAICNAVGIGMLVDSDELFGKVLRIRTKIRPAQGDYPARAEVSGYEPMAVPTKASTPARNFTEPAAQPAKSAAPWMKK